MVRGCLDCGTPISRFSKGRCRPCATAISFSNPDIQAKRAERLKEVLSSEEWQKGQAERNRKLGSHPGLLEKRREAGRKHYHITIGSERAKARALEPEVCARRNASLSGTLMAHIPEQYRDEYRRLRMSKRLSAAEAEAVIFGSIEAERRRKERQRANLSPFERQERALNNGAGLSEALTIKTIDGTRKLG